MEILVFAAILSFVVAFVATPVVIKVADAKKLFDQPSAHKIHFTPIPTFGGISFFVAVLFSVILLVSFKEAPELQNFIAASIVIFFIGLKDDVYLISPTKKFLGQLLAIFLLSYQGAFELNTLQGLFGVNELHPIVSTLFTYLTFLVIINAFNLIDGVDGLAALLGVIASAFFGISFYIAGDLPYAVVAFSLVFSLIGFLIYNFSPARIFMGDTGSLFLGLVIAVLAVRFIRMDPGLLKNMDISQTGAMAFAAVFVPIMDTVRVFLIRIYKGVSPFDRDVNHIHHILLHKGYSHLRVSLTLFFIELLMLALAFFVQPLGINALITSLLVSGLLLIWLFSHIKSNSRVDELAESIDQKPTLINRKRFKRSIFNN